MDRKNTDYVRSEKNAKDEGDAKFLAYMKEARDVDKTMLQVMAGRQYSGAECVYFEDLNDAVPTSLGFFIVGGFLADGEKSGVLESVNGAKGKGYRIVPERLDAVRSMWQI